MKNIMGFLLILLVLSGCSGGKQYDSASGGAASNAMREGMVLKESEMETADASYDYPMVAQAPGNEPAPMPAEGGGLSGIFTAAVAEKIIQTANVGMQTDQFDKVMEGLRAAAPDAGGFVERAELSDYYIRNNMRRRIFHITLRIPRERFDEVCRIVEGLAKVDYSNQNAEDVTARYYDIAGRLETKKIEEERVLDMISRADEINDLLALEYRLGQIRTQIEIYHSQMTNIDRQAAYSTIHVTLYEVTKEELITLSEGLGGRIQQALHSSWNNTVRFLQNIIIFLAGAFIPIIFCGILVFAGLKTIKTVNKRKIKESL